VNEPLPPSDRTDLPRPVSRPERLLPLACIGGAAVLFASDLMTTFEFTGAGGEPLCLQDAGERHSYSLAVLSAFAILCVLGALLAGSKPAALAVAGSGVLALLIFLIADLPDAGQVGTLGSECGGLAGELFVQAEAEPQWGFWLEMTGAVALALSGLALATLTSEQLAALRPRWLDRMRPARATDSAEASTPLFDRELVNGQPDENPRRARRRTR
jgi:peptidoglycan/LPS O-acetylase OafA/YrhL